MFKSLLVGLLLTASGCATSPEKLTSLTANSYRIVGKFSKTEYDKLIDIVNQHQGEPLAFYVTSHGGNSDDLILAMDALYQHGNVQWNSVGRCDSACAVLALSSKHAYGDIRLHSFYSFYHHKPYAAPEFNRVILDKLESYGYKIKDIGYMFDRVDTLWEVTVVDGHIIYETAHATVEKY